MAGKIESSTFVITCASLSVYFGIPVILSWIVASGTTSLSDGALSLAVSVFAIVSALLFGALFSIFSVVSSINREKLGREFRNIASFKRKLRAINRRVVYLVGVSALSVCICFFFFLVDLDETIEVIVLVFLVSHFFCVFFPVLVEVFKVLELGYRKF